MLRGRVAVGTGRTHQESRHPVRSVQLVGRSVQEEARQAAEEPSYRGVERLRRRVHGRFSTSDIHQFQIAQTVSTGTAVGRSRSAHADNTGKTRSFYIVVFLIFFILFPGPFELRTVV